MTDNTDLCKRLRGSANFLDKAGFTGFPLIAKDCREAADSLEKQRDRKEHYKRILRDTEAENAALRKDEKRLDWLDIQADDWTYKGSKVWKLIGPRLSIREVIDDAMPTTEDAAMREGNSHDGT